MRRNTEAAYEMGRQLYLIREEKGITQSEIARRLKITPGNISLIESGKRSFKEWRIPAFASAYEINERTLRAAWKKCNSIDPGPIAIRPRNVVSKTKFQRLVDELTAAERQRVLGYIEAVIEDRRYT